MQKAAFFFCTNIEVDFVAPRVFSFVTQKELVQTELFVEGNPVLRETDSEGNIFDYVRTDEIVLCNYQRYLPILKEYFSDYDFIGIINWHNGANAPDKVLTIHATGDVTSGIFSPSSGAHMKNFMLALEENRKEIGLDDFRVMLEATHWGGVMYDQSEELIRQFNRPVYDIEIGSSQESFANLDAAKTIALSLNKVFEGNQEIYNLIYFGGVHFEQDCTDIMLQKELPVAVAHLLPNYWIVNDGYLEQAGVEKLVDCKENVVGNLSGVIFNDNLKGRYKQTCKTFAEQFGCQSSKHRILRNNEELLQLLKTPVVK